MRPLLKRIAALFQRRRLDAELDEEIRTHLEMAIDEYVRRGMSRQDAERAARRDFGGIERTRERHREARGIGWLENLLRDLRYGARNVLRRPVQTITVLVALSLGTGLPTLTFSLIRSALLTELPFEDAERIVKIRRVGPEAVTAVEYEAWSRRQRSFEALAAARRARVTLDADGPGTEPVSGAAVTASTFAVLGVEPALGRAFTESDATPGAPAVVLLGHEVWRERFGAARSAVGRIVRVDGRQAEIVGIMPEGFGFPYDEQVWTPLGMDALREPLPGATNVSETQLVTGRLRQGIDARAAAGELTAITRDLHRELRGTEDAASLVNVRAYTDLFSETGQSALLAALMLGVSLMVLLVACANVANVLLAQTVARRRDVAIRMAIGASRLRIAAQLWTETALLALAGSAGGIVIALIGTRFVAAAVPAGLPFWVEFRLQLSALVFVVGVAVLAALFAGVAPALQATRATTHDVLRDESRGSSGFHLGRVMRRLIGAELALSFVLLVGAGLFVRSAANYDRTDFPFEPETVYTAHLRLPETRYADAASRARFAEELRASLRALPQLSGVALTTAVPGVGAGGRTTSVEVEGGAVSVAAALPTARTISVTPGFFGVFRASLLAGRDFDARDRAGTLPVAIVNEAFADAHLSGDAVGRRIRLGMGTSDQDWVTIVGVGPDLMPGGVDAPRSEAVYLPISQNPPADFRIAARFQGDFASLAAPVREQVAGLDPDVPLASVLPHRQVIDQANAQYVWFSALFLISGAVALFLAAIGLYGVMSFWVIHRTREIGVRMALGGQRGEILRLVLRQGIAQTSFGLIAGVLLAAPAARLLSSALYGVEPWDPIVFGSIAGVLLAIAGLGCWLPARRATRVDPLRALAAE